MCNLLAYFSVQLLPLSKRLCFTLVFWLLVLSTSRLTKDMDEIFGKGIKFILASIPILVH